MTQALDRIIDVFPPERQEQIRVQLAGALSAIIAQRLIVKPKGGRVAAFEVLIANPAIRNLIREGKTRQIRNVLTTSQAIGMQTLEMSLYPVDEFGYYHPRVSHGDCHRSRRSRPLNAQKAPPEGGAY